MDLRQLRYFTAIVEQGSFSKAATKLRVAQPALSQHLRHMEDELGVALLHRGTRGVLPTEAGERLLLRARAILAEFAELRDSVRGETAAPGGEVRIGLPGTVSEQFSVPLIQAARERYPAVRIRIAEAMSGFVLDWLRRGEVDLAVIYTISDPKGLGIHHILTEELCLFGPPTLDAVKTPPGGTVTLSEAAAVDLILPGIGHGLRDQIDEAALSVGAAIQPAIEIESYTQIKRLAERGLGYSILPRMAVRAQEKAGLFQTWRIAQPSLYRKVYLAYSTERPIPAAARAIGQLSWEILRGLVSDESWTATLGEDDDPPALYG
ncbi:LysR family transcriptional regulator, nitrogen assimilation regulatory protein [Bosea sp. OK403]|uniref:LysR family transcriptional regulator n=1 Tax=Bosea sp. OK403 TaxID=1855286 RepID=UPI0008E14B16|nr:LysR substrate-binding domain-containing protein [Bosea sp. OK403]SFH95713.1 LysR family transcriptional regulator, nitrogen assimilation regulatory protein [Bosea sp. OK403]